MDSMALGLLSRRESRKDLWPRLIMLEIWPRGNNILVIIILYFIVHDNCLLSMLQLY